MSSSKTTIPNLVHRHIFIMYLLYLLKSVHDLSPLERLHTLSSGNCNTFGSTCRLSKPVLRQRLDLTVVVSEYDILEIFLGNSF